MSDKPTLGYWDIRGLAQPIRNLLKYAGVDYQEKHYPFGPGKTLAEWDLVIEHWKIDKFTLGLDFPNLPYWIDGDVKLTNHLAILKYLARKYGLIAIDSVSLANQEMLEQQLYDYRVAIASVWYSGDAYHEKKEHYMNNQITQHLETLDNYLGDKEWFTDEFSYVDFLAYELLDWIRMFSLSSFVKYPRLKAYMDGFESLPAIKKYHNSSEYKRWPIVSPVANWGYHKSS